MVDLRFVIGILTPTSYRKQLVMTIFSLKTIPEDVSQVIVEIEEFRKILKHSTSENQRRWTGLLRSAFALAIQGSNSIEGYNVTYQDAMAAVDDEEPEIDQKTETWMAISGYRAALTYVLQLADDAHFDYSDGLLRSLHFMMLGYDIGKHPGRWRPGAIWVKREATGETVYEGPEASLVPGLMSELVQSLRETNNLPVIVRAALAHLNLVMIHPFSDGNGRMGRALQTLVLAREGIIDARFSSIEEILAKFTLEYYDVLAQVGQGAWHPERDPMPFVTFCIGLHHRQAQTWLWRVRQMDKFWHAIEEESKRRRLNERMNFALADAAVGIKVSNSRYRKFADVSDQVASKDFKVLTDEGLLIAKGEKRGRHYVAGKWLIDLRKRLHERMELTDPFAQRKGRAKGEVVQEYLPGLAPS